MLFKMLLVQRFTNGQQCLPISGMSHFRIFRKRSYHMKLTYVTWTWLNMYRIHNLLNYNALNALPELYWEESVEFLTATREFVNICKFNESRCKICISVFCDFIQYKRKKLSQNWLGKLFIFLRFNEKAITIFLLFYKLFFVRFS